MKNKILLFVGLFFLLLVFSLPAQAQCSICTRTAEQLGDTPARSLNVGILYLAAVPLAIYAVIGYRWWKKNSGA